MELVAILSLNPYLKLGEIKTKEAIRYGLAFFVYSPGLSSVVQPHYTGENSMTDKNKDTELEVQEITGQQLLDLTGDTSVWQGLCGSHIGGHLVLYQGPSQDEARNAGIKHWQENPGHQTYVWQVA